PILASPIGTIQNATPTFTWNVVTGAAYYELWVNDVTAGRAQVVYNPHVTGNTMTPAGPLTAGDAYQWWVRAFSSTGAAGAWSTAAAFTIGLLTRPSPLGPTGSLQGASASFSWSAAAGADNYDLWINDVTTGQSQGLRNSQ